MSSQAHLPLLVFLTALLASSLAAAGTPDHAAFQADAAAVSDTAGCLRVHHQGGDPDPGMLDLDADLSSQDKRVGVSYGGYTGIRVSCGL